MSTMYNKPHLYTLKLAPSFSQNPGKSNTHFSPVVKINIILNNNIIKNTEFIPNTTTKAPWPELPPHWKLVHCRVPQLTRWEHKKLNNTSKTNMYETQVFHLLTYPPTSCAILSLILSINSVSDTPCRLGLPPGLPIEKKPFKKRVF